MADTTPIYHLPFYELADPPNLADASKTLALGVESQLQRIDAAIATINALDPVEVDESTDLVTQTNTTFAPGSPVCGTAFVAPPSGKVYITISGHMQGNATNSLAYLSYEVRTGATVGTGTVVQAPITDKGIGTGAVVAGLTQSRASQSRRNLQTGLTPGDTYNVRAMYLMAGTGSISVFSRELLIEPVL